MSVMMRYVLILAHVRKRGGSEDLFVQMVGLEFTDFGESYCEGVLTIEDKHLNPMGTVHGGCLYTLADTVGGEAAAGDGRLGPTSSGNMFFIRSTKDTKKLTARANVVNRGSRLCVVEVGIFRDDEAEVARGIFEYVCG